MSQVVTYESSSPIPDSTQELDVNLICTVQCTQYPGNPVYFTADFTASRFKAAGAKNNSQMVENIDEKRGYFLTRIENEVWLSSDSHGRTQAEYKLIARGPGTTSPVGSFTSSSTYSFSSNAGFFGDVPTGGVGGGYSFGTSASVSMPEFAVDDNSQDNVARHVFKLAKSKDGYPISEPNDLVDTSWAGHVREIPDIAVSGLPIAVTGLWMSEKANPPDYLRMNIRTRYTVAKVEKTYKVFTIQKDTYPFTQTLNMAWDFSISSLLSGKLGE